MTDRSTGAPTPPIADQRIAFAIPPTENPIRFGAAELRRYIGQFANDDLEGIFPDMPHSGDSSSLVFLRIHQDPRDSLSIQPVLVLKGSSIYKGYPAMTEGKLDFSRASLEPARDIDVVEHAPALVDTLFRELADDLEYSPDASKAQRVIEALERREEIKSRVREISLTSLLASKERTAHDGALDRTLLQARAALALWNDRESLILRAQQLDNGGYSETERYLKGLIDRARETGLFEGKAASEHTLLVDPEEGEPIGLAMGESIVPVSNQDNRVMLITSDGQIGKKWHGGLDAFFLSSQDIITRRVELTKGIIALAVASRFPQLIWDQKAA